MTHPRRRLFCLAALPILLSAASDALAQFDADEFPPGLLGKYTADGKTVERVDPDVAFEWGASVPDVRLSRKRPFAVEWTGRVLLKKSDAYTFHAFVAGDVAIEVDGKIVLNGKRTSAGRISGKPVDLRIGFRNLKVRYRKTGANAMCRLFWSSKSFPPEPIPPHLLFRLEPNKELARVDTGRQLFAAHRCNRCHVRENDPPSSPGPDLTHVVSGLSLENLIAKIHGRLRLSAKPQAAKMPAFGFTKDESAAVAAFLRSVSKPVKLKPLPKPRRRKKGQLSEERAGEILLRSVGCLACHTVGDLGNAGPFSGGDLRKVSPKRSTEWLYQWLTDPKRLNADHRMPVFKLTTSERRELAVYLTSLGNQKVGGKRAAPVRKRVSTKDTDGRPRSLTVATRDDKTIALGRKLVEQARCAACHTIPGIKFTTAKLPDLSRTPINHRNTCLQKTADRKKRRPAFSQLDVESVAAIAAFLKSREGVLSPLSEFESGRLVLERRNCTACHPRGLQNGLVETAGLVSKLDKHFAGQSQALIPPALNAVGDKLLDDYLKTAIAGEQKSVRLPWLAVRMPRFAHTKRDAAALISYLKAHDRIPDGLESRAKPQAAKLPGESQVLVAGQTLLGIRGFSCIACHKVGEYEPRNTAVGTRGSDLMQMAGRMRRPFFDRWTRSAIRIVPGMEMPSYHGKPVPGVLKDDVDLQLAVLWQALNDKRFKPPTNPSVVEQFITVNPGEPARIIRDVFTVPKENGGGYVARSLAIGLNNGHNLLFDLDTYSLRGWYFGDFARQRTEGKSWYWDMAGVPVMTGLKPGPDIILVKKDKKTGKETVLVPKLGGLRSYSVFDDRGVTLSYVFEIKVDGKQKLFFGKDRIRLIRRNKKGTTTWTRWITAHVWDTTGKELKFETTEYLKPYFGRPIPLSSIGNADIRIAAGTKEAMSAKWKRFAAIPDHEYQPFSIGLAEVLPPWEVIVEYSASLRRERTRVQIKKEKEDSKLRPESVATVPGFDGIRLPIDRSIMPTAVTWDRQRRFTFSSLKGDVYVAVDSNGDGIEDRLTKIEEGLAAPYGVIDTKDGLIVSQKPELLRLSTDKQDRETLVRDVLATGWGYTDNYHDWTCGIVRDKQGNLYVGLGSDYAQPKRPKDKAKWRGKVLRISPKGKITPVGHSFRYPTGLAMNDAGDIFVTDNQGVQNTFNEINHLKEGRHYGVPSRYEGNRDAKVTPPAIQIPHPWTRSVNGIFFLPKRAPLLRRVAAKRDSHVASERKSYFVKAFAGHGIGCEYDNRFLIRFSLQKVGGEYQGACYAFSKPNSGVGGKNFTGPLCGGVAPDGAIYIGSIYDSGWLGGRNTGDIVRLVPNGKLPNGIRELRVTKDGFEIKFIRPVDREQAGKPGAYSILGYNRIWKGSYATPDSNRHTLKVKSVAVSKDNKTVRLNVPNRRAGGYVYEVSVGKIGETSQPELWPATGYYTLHRIPKK